MVAVHCHNQLRLESVQSVDVQPERHVCRGQIGNARAECGYNAGRIL